MYHDRTALRAFFVGKKYGSKGYPQRNAAHMGSISLRIALPTTPNIEHNKVLLKLDETSMHICF
jgi:hypothetical protein